MSIYVSAALIPRDLSQDKLPDKNVVVIDVLRATTTLVTALENGAESVIPVATPEEALEKKPSSSTEHVLLCGERGGIKCPGFDLGNSPREYTSDRVAGKRIIFTSTNGSRMMLMAKPARRIFLGAFINGRACAGRLADSGRDCLIACAGDNGRFSLEDAVCAGMIIEFLRESAPSIALDDEAIAAEILYKAYAGDIPALLKNTVHGRRLAAIGFEEDLEFCAAENATDALPVLMNGELIL